MDSRPSSGPISPVRRLGVGLGAVVLVLLGLALISRPFASLTLLVLTVVVGLLAAGVARLAERVPAADTTPLAVRLAPGLAYLVSGVALAMWSGVTLAHLALLVGLVLLVDAAADLWSAWRGRGSARVADLLGGLSSLLLAALALAWPDVTTLVVAVVFGVRVVTMGVRLLLGAVRGRALEPRRSARGRPGRWRVVSQAAGLGVAAVLVAVSAIVHASASHPDAFYTAPEQTPARPGTLLRSQPFTSAEVPQDGRAWRILYSTTADDGTPTVASGLVIAPADSGQAPAPVIAWAHGTTGASAGCAPSVLTGGLAAGAMVVQDQILDRGWAMVATDYVGLGTSAPHEYLVGPPAGRAVLDSVRAAHQLADAHLADQTVVWGHSQGGAAALWTGQLAATYAPELEIDGIVALAPASNPPALLDSLGNVTGGDLFASYVIAGYAAAYPDITMSEYVRPAARPIASEMAQRCLSDHGTVVSVLVTLLLEKPIWSADPDRGALRDRLAQSIPAGPIDPPLLLAQGEADTLVIPSAQAQYVQARCAAGYPLDYRTYPGLGHVALVEPDSPAVTDALAWTAQRLAGQPAQDTCS